MVLGHGVYHRTADTQEARCSETQAGSRILLFGAFRVGSGSRRSTHHGINGLGWGEEEDPQKEELLMKGDCPVCGHMEAYAVDRFLVMPHGTPGKRGPRSLASVFGLDRRALARHERMCLVGEKREKVLADLARLGGRDGL